MRIRDDVKLALGTIVPALSTAHAKAVSSRQGRIRAARQGGLAKARKMRQEAEMAVTSHTITQASRDTVRIHPVRRAAYGGDGRTDMQARQASIDRERSPGSRDGMLSEIHRRRV